MTAAYVNLWQLYLLSVASFSCLNIYVVQNLVDAAIFSLKFTKIPGFGTAFGFVASVSYRQVLGTEVGLQLL